MTRKYELILTVGGKNRLPTAEEIGKAVVSACKTKEASCAVVVADEGRSIPTDSNEKVIANFTRLKIVCRVDWDKEKGGKFGWRGDGVPPKRYAITIGYEELAKEKIVTKIDEKNCAIDMSKLRYLLEMDLPDDAGYPLLEFNIVSVKGMK